MQFLRVALVAMAVIGVSEAGLEDQPDPIQDLGLIHAVVPITMRGITGRFWWSPIRVLPFEPGFRVGNPPFQKVSSIFDITTGGKGDFYSRESNTPPEVIASACVLLLLSIQGLALPLYGGISRDGKMIGFVNSPLNRGLASARLVCGNAGVESMSPLAAQAFDSVREAVAKSVIQTRKILLLLAFAGYHALMIREFQVVLDVNDESWSQIEDLRRPDMSDVQFRFSLIIYVQQLATSTFDSVFLRALRTMWAGRVHNFLQDEHRFAAAVSRIAPLCTGVLFRNLNKNMQFGLSRQFAEEAFVDPTTNRIFASSESDANDFEESSLRLIRDCMAGDWSEFKPPTLADTDLPEMRAFIHLDDSMNVMEDTTAVANTIQDSNRALLFLFGGALRPFVGVFVERTRRETGSRKSDFCRFFSEMDSVAFDRLEGRQATSEIEDQSTLEKKIVDVAPLVEIVRKCTDSEALNSVFDIISGSQSAFTSRNLSRVEKMTATDNRDGFATLTRSQIRWIRDNSRGSAKAKAAPPAPSQSALVNPYSEYA